MPDRDAVGVGNWWCDLLAGFAAAFDCWVRPARMARSDAEALREDWQAVGNDLLSIFLSIFPSEPVAPKIVEIDEGRR